MNNIKLDDFQELNANDMYVVTGGGILTDFFTTFSGSINTSLGSNSILPQLFAPITAIIGAVLGGLGSLFGGGGATA